MGDITPEPQTDFKFILIVIFGGCIMVLAIVLLIAYIRYMEKRYASRWREWVATRANRHQSTGNGEAQNIPLESLPTFIYIEEQNEEMSTNLAPESTVVRAEGPGEGILTEEESEPALVHGGRLSQDIVTALEWESTPFHLEELWGERLRDQTETTMDGEEGERSDMDDRPPPYVR